MILGEYLSGILQVKVVFADRIPWKIQHELEEVILNTVVRRAWIIALELHQFLLEVLSRLLRPVLVSGLLAELLEVAGLIHTKFLLDGPELVIKEEFSLLLVNLALNLAIDLLLDVLELKLDVKKGKQLHRTLLKVVILEECSLVCEVVNFDRRSHEIGKHTEVIKGTERLDRLLAHHRRGLHDGAGLLFQCLHDELVLLALLVADELIDVVDRCIEIWLVCNDVVNDYALDHGEIEDANAYQRSEVEENIELPLLYMGLPKSERKKRIQEAMERMAISHRAKHFPQQLSGGQQQRVAIARACVANPKLILADEPTGNLDSKNGREVMQLLQELNQEGATIVMVTHSQKDAAMAQRTIDLFDGKIVSDVKNEL